MTISSLVLLSGIACAGPADPPPPVAVAPAPREVGPPVAVAPLPREVGPRVAFAPVKGGYQITLDRRTAERLQDALDRTDEKEIAEALRDLAKDARDDDPDGHTAGKLELAAFVVASQVPGFRQALRENAGPGGVVITLTGLQKPPVKTGRRRLDRALGIARGVAPLLPADARETIQALDAMARTTPLSWKVEPRE